MTLSPLRASVARLSRAVRGRLTRRSRLPPPTMTTPPGAIPRLPSATGTTPPGRLPSLGPGSPSEWEFFHELLRNANHRQVSPQEKAWTNWLKRPYTPGSTDATQAQEQMRRLFGSGAGRQPWWEAPPERLREAFAQRARELDLPTPRSVRHGGSVDPTDTIDFGRPSASEVLQSIDPTNTVDLRQALESSSPRSSSQSSGGWARRWGARVRAALSRRLVGAIGVGALVGLILAVGIHLNRQQEAVLEGIPPSAEGVLSLGVLGEAPAPEGTPAGDCARVVALEQGFIWTADGGWRSPRNLPQPIEGVDDLGGGTFDQVLAEWADTLGTRIGFLEQDIAARCGALTEGQQYFIFSLDNVSGGTLFIGTMESVDSALACNFIGGGLCTDPDGDGDLTDSNPFVEYTFLDNGFPTRAAAETIYCQAVTGEPSNMALTGGAKVTAFGGSYWADYMPDCPSG